MVNFVVRNIKKMVPKFELPNTVSFKDAVAEGKKLRSIHLKMALIESLHINIQAEQQE
jgi:hypothetical protein